MQAIGMIETKGLLPAVESADAMLKTAEVRLIDKTLTGGGLVAVTVTGEVAAVMAAVDAGAAAVGRITGAVLVCQHVIPRPDVMLEGFFSSAEHAAPEADIAAQDSLPETEQDDTEGEKPDGQEQERPQEQETAAEGQSAPSYSSGGFRKTDADRVMQEAGAEEVLRVLEGFKVVKLRNLAREYENFGITGRLISSAGKDELMTEFKSYYAAQEQTE